MTTWDPELGKSPHNPCSIRGSQSGGATHDYMTSTRLGAGRNKRAP